jgi:5-(carboxyamino)imidazole ribonucleotide mutase
MKTLVSIVMGSDSDLEIMRAAGKALEEFGIAYEIDVTSAHRSPDRTADFARKAASRGIRVIIAGAGGAAHLAGVIAAHTTLPVIGVPIPSTSLQGWIPCSPPCRCRRAFRWLPSRSGSPAPPMPAFSPRR